MLENRFIRKLLYANTLIWICVTFTIATVLDMVLTVAIFGDVGTTYQHLATRLVICIFVSVSLLVFRVFKRLPFPVIMGLHFAACMGFAVLYVWISGFFVEMHPRAMFYMVRSVLFIYPGIAAGCICFDWVLKMREKRKGRAMQKGASE